MWRADCRRCCSVSGIAIDGIMVAPAYAETGWVGEFDHTATRGRLRSAAQATTAASFRNWGRGVEALALAARSKMRRY